MSATPPGRSTSTLLVELAVASKLELFRDTDRGAAWASLHVDKTETVASHVEHWPLRARGFKQWLRGRFYQQCGRAANEQSVNDALGVLEAQAQSSPAYSVYVRVAGQGDDAIYLDLARDDWRVIKVTAERWDLVADPGVRFRRPRGMQELPIPISGGHLANLRRFVRAPDKQWPLVLAWLAAALRPRGPYPLLIFSGEQGSTKTMGQAFLRALIDPNSAPLRTAPRDPRDLAVTARNSWVLAYDNLSHVEPWLSDSLCRLATGGGFATRELYSDDEEAIFSATRPCLLNGITTAATRPDLLDRALVVELEPIDEEHRIAASTLETAFLGARPFFLGALLDALVIALRRLTSIEFERLPRMADLALWATAAEPGLGLEPGAFMKVYTGNRAAANEMALEASPIATPVSALVEREGQWSNTVGALLEELGKLVSDQIRHAPDWPKTTQALSGRLRRIAPNLRAIGIEVQFGEKTNRGRLIHLHGVARKDPGKIVTIVTNITSPAQSGLDRGDRRDDPHAKAVPVITELTPQKTTARDRREDRDDAAGSLSEGTSPRRSSRQDGLPL
jgi:hypothetical protein